MDAAERLADRARSESWSHAEFLVACLQHEVAARESHGGEARIRSARFPAIKTIEELDVTHLRGMTREQGRGRTGRPPPLSYQHSLRSSASLAGGPGSRR